MSINSIGMREIILSAYYNNPRVADDDDLLLSIVWKKRGWSNDKSLLENLRSMPSSETVRRTRQKLVSEGLMTPSVSAMERRYKNYRRTRRELGYEL